MNSGDTPASVRAIWSLGWPTVATYAAFSARQFTDTWMVGQLGTESLAALMPAQQILFLIQGFAYGLFSALNTCASHALAKTDGKSRCASYAWQCIWIALVLGLLAMALYPATEPIFTALGHEFAVYVEEVAYFKIAIFALLPQFVAVSLSNFFFAAKQPLAPMWSGLGHVILNVLFNYMFMFGVEGWIEPMGIAGAAWGTLAASVIWAIALFGVFISARLKEYHTRQPSFSLKRMRNLLAIGLPNGAIDVVDILFWNLALVVFIAGFGTAHMAAASVMFTLWIVILVPCDGLGVAVTTMVGHQLGKRDEAGAFRYVRSCLKLNTAVVAVAGLLCFLFRDAIMASISDDPLVQQIGARCMILLSLSLVIDGVLYVFDSALNGAGDAVWPLKMNMICNLLLILGGGLLVTRYFAGWASFGIWSCLVINRFVIASVFILRWNSRKWRDFEPVNE